MKQEERKRRRKRKKRLRLIFVGLIFIYLFFRSVPSLFAIGPKTKLPEKHIIEDKIETEAIIIKQENVYHADGEGKIELFGTEGERIPVGEKIAELTLLTDTSTLNQQLEEVENKIDILIKTDMENKSVDNDEKKIEENIDDIIEDIQRSISKEDYENAEILKDKLSMYNEKQRDVSGDKTLINKSLDNLKDQRENIKKQISNNVFNYFSKEAGIVSFKIDGYEEEYSFNNKDDYEYSDFKEFSKDENAVVSGSVEAGQPVFKIINNFQWYMIIKIEEIEDIASYEEGDPILLVGEQIEDELEGYIEKINKDKGKGLILCKFNVDFQHYYDKRHMNVDIIKYKYNGFRIPSESIIEIDDVEGVYIRDISGIIRFRPIEILDEDDEFTYISIGDKNNNINIEGHDDPVRTVRQFDEILLKTKNIEEGIIID